ncbi:hypothetical protein DUNSADRAFT_8855 [Dunaliella salina]|uniref:Uncharacterized protein n=1 Tax=Dunaliella salina TaxID=3046 RepID=A0ABQ7H5N3_DUNSA|nr:hypothetical protein DUNSADRAFT_8855 [Dunaliella salina]|eukprot:KAF5842168.1 hypothetical protein DUNSADRAFT_8855 [Dunaliella salina]
MIRAPAGTATSCLHASVHHAMSESSKLSRQRPPPLSQSNTDAPLILADPQAPSHESPVTPELDSGGRGTTRHRRSSLLGTPSIPQTLSPSSAPRPVVVPPKSPLLSAFALPAAAAPFPPSAPNRAFARSLSCSSNGVAAMQAGEGKVLEGQESLVRAKTLLVPMGNTPSIPWQAEDKLPPSTRLLPSLQIAPRASSRSFDAKSDNGSTRQHSFLPPEVIRTSGTHGPMAPDLLQYSRKSAPAQSTVATVVLPAWHSGSSSPVSDDGSMPLQPTPPKQQPCAFRRKTILAPIHHLRQPSHKRLSPSQVRSSDNGTEGVEIDHHHHQQQQPEPHPNDATGLGGAQSLSPQASSVSLGGGAFKRRSSGIQKQVTIALDHDLDNAEASMALHQNTRRRSTGEKLSRPGTPAAGLRRQADGEGGRLVGRFARWSCMGLLGTGDTPLSRELLACEREKRLRLKASESCEQLARANAQANPAAFCAAAVEEEEAKRGLAAEAAQQSLKRLERRPSNDMQAMDHFHTQVRLLRASRSFYHAPEAEKQRVTRASIVPRGPWTLQHSLFQQRALENDARDIFDTPEV